MNHAGRWIEANQRFLMAEVARIRQALKQAVTDAEESAQPAEEPQYPDFSDLPPPALATLCAAFGLSPFERDVLLLCAACELDGSFPALVAQAHAAGDAARPYPTFGLALATLSEPHWSALAPAAPLRRWRLIEVVNANGDPLVAARLRIDERVLHHLAGLDYLDERLAALVQPVQMADDLSPTQAAVAEQIAMAWRNASSSSTIQLCGDDGAVKRAVAAAACRQAGLILYSLDADEIPANAYERETLARLWERETALSGAVLMLECSETAAHVAAFVDELEGPLIVASRERLRSRTRELARFEVNRPRWQSPQAVAAAYQRNGGDGQIEELAQRIEPLATWADLVLPAAQIGTLREIAAQVRQMGVVYSDWGFASKCARGLGISALFVGASGTGKTMAAEVLANELGLDLYRIDLSAVVSKYIGETEKNLRRVFDAAEQTGAILLFDEADALFGKRSEVKDSHDRYANIEISYLLQRMEAYRGLAILTTNFKAVMDTAFLRRIRFIVTFPFPDAAQRAEIWRRIFPAQTPLDGVNVERLTQLNVAGGSIRNIAMNAAFLAADAGERVSMTHLLAAARSEYAKLEKPLSEAELRNW